MGLFDLPSFALTWIDSNALGFLPSVARLVVWGLIAGIASMLLYKVLSPQRAINRCKARSSDLKERLSEYDGELSGVWEIARPLLSNSLRQVKLAATPAVLASIPILFLLAWVSTEYGYRYPAPGEPVAARAASEAHDARWVENGSLPHVVVSDARGNTVADVPVTKPVPVLHKRHWWNALIGNPAGYLPKEAGVERVEIALPRLEYVGVGPSWLRGWEAVFFASLLLGSIGLKVAGRIE